MFYTSMSVVPKLVMQHWARSREVAGHGQLPVLGHGGVSDGKRGGAAVVLSTRGDSIWPCPRQPRFCPVCHRRGLGGAVLLTLFSTCVQFSGNGAS